MGTQDKAKVYRGRLLPDKQGQFYKKYYYHFFKSGEKASYVKCNKTDNFDNYCPWCHANQILWKGNSNDQKKAALYKRNERFCSNFFIIEDPRDSDTASEYKVNGKVRLYEFPATIESKIVNELTNEQEGYGSAIFDPEDGYDLQVRIKAKKPDAKGKVWPDYSDTMFSRSKSSIAETEAEIKEIMNTVYDLNEYINSINVDWEVQEKLLKQELLWDDVKDTFMKNVPGYSSSEEEKEVDTKSDVKEDDNPFVDEKKEDKKTNDDEPSDEDLLNELNNLG
jgi:hypothetical protein